jgi:hypothetical protein
MTLSDYYKILGLPANSSVDEIKKAYRKKAHMYHPDINPSPDAKEKFILATEAYEFLLANYNKLTKDNEAYHKAMEEWRIYRQDRSRQRARAYSQASYVRFKNTNFYKTTRIFDGTTIIFSLVISIMIIVITISGYFYGIKHPVPYQDPPTILGLIMFLTLGMIFFTVSVIFLKAYIEASRKHKTNYR